MHSAGSFSRHSSGYLLIKWQKWDLFRLQTTENKMVILRLESSPLHSERQFNQSFLSTLAHCPQPCSCCHIKQESAFFKRISRSFLLVNDCKVHNSRRNHQKKKKRCSIKVYSIFLKIILCNNQMLSYPVGKGQAVI